VSELYVPLIKTFRLHWHMTHSVLARTITHSYSRSQVMSLFTAWLNTHSSRFWWLLEDQIMRKSRWKELAVASLTQKKWLSNSNPQVSKICFGKTNLVLHEERHNGNTYNVTLWSD